MNYRLTKYRMMAPSILNILASTNNLSFQTASFIDFLKPGKVYPIFEGTTSNDVNTYRPLLTLPLISQKLFISRLFS